MDDALERPSANPVPDIAEKHKEEEDGQSSGDEDQGPDWTKLPKVPSVNRPVIPKRGEKDFEPSVAGGSGYQRHVLDRSRNAMLDALRATRSISNKSASYAIWNPDLQRAHVTVARGIHFQNMGHSVSRVSPTPEGVMKVQKRLELLPEEALYLVERGAVFCWKASELIPPQEDPEEMSGVPMSVQEAFAEMIGKEDLTLEKYQVYAYLKRLGYVVTRTNPPNPDYPVPPSFSGPPALSQSFTRRVYEAISSAWSRLRSLFFGKFDWWKPLRFNRWLHHNVTYPSVFKSLRFLPSGHSVGLNVKTNPNKLSSPYQIFYNLYKPSTPFKKTSPPQPDFSIVVVNARTTPMPSLVELTALFDVLPELPPPTTRKRLSFAAQKAQAQAQTQTTTTSTASQTVSPPAAPLWRRLFPWTWSWSSQGQDRKPRGVHPFLALKTGKKMVVIAAVDAGTTTFYRFAQGAFEEWPMA